MVELKKRYVNTCIFGLISVFSIGEAISYLTLQWLNIPNTPWPWSFLSVLSHGLYPEVALSLVMVLIPVLILKNCLVGGIRRYIASISIGIVICLLIAFALGLFIFQWVDNMAPASFWELLEFLEDLSHDNVSFKHFLIAESVAIALTGFIPTYLLLKRIRAEGKVLGDAHFASGLEIHRARFFKKEEQNIIIGKKYGAPIYANGFEHVLVFAPTGSGKTCSIGIPNLLQYPYSVVCNDVKLTMFKTTSGYREQKLGHRCYCWAPASEDRKTHRYNPLSLISNDKFQRITDIQRIAHILMPDHKKSDPIWTQASRKLFKIMVLYLLDTPGSLKTLGEINRLVKQAQFDDWLASQLEETSHYDAEFYRNGFSYLNNHEKTRSSILETFSGYFELFDDPIIDAATSASDFDLRALRREKITIYIGFTDDDMERLSPLLTLFWQQLISVMINKIPDLKEEPYPLLCLMDEFSSLGRIERLRRSLKLLREYRVRCVLIVQYIAQTYEQYTHDEAKAFTNIKTKIAFATEDINDAEFVSKLLGTKTVRVDTGSISNQSQGYSKSKSYTYQALPLLRPDEVMRLPQYQSLIMRTGHAPVKAQQLIWYEAASMKDLACGETEVPQQAMIQHPFIHPIKPELSLLETTET